MTTKARLRRRLLFGNGHQAHIPVVYISIINIVASINAIHAVCVKGIVSR